MPFSIQSRLIEFEYLGGGNEEPDLEYQEMAESYQNVIDFAFFVTNFNYTKSDYEALTPKDKMFIMKAWETKLVSDTTHIRNSVLNAVNNSMRKKNSKFSDLWKKKQKSLDVDKVKDDLAIINEIEKGGKSWVELVYLKAGKTVPKKRGVAIE